MKEALDLEVEGLGYKTAPPHHGESWQYASYL